jgi:hypothetical protein
VTLFRTKFASKVRPLPIKSNATTSFLLVIPDERLNITPNDRRVNPEMKRQI